MRKILFLLGFTLLFFSCNDGDIIEYEVNFDAIETIDYCGDLVLYKIKEEPFESLSIQLNTTFQDLIDSYDPEGTNTIEFLLTDSNNTFVYRSYADAYNATLASNLFCNDIPTNVTIATDNESTQGSVFITISLAEDDGDGIPAAIEDKNLDGDDDPSTNPTDTDGDGIPDYLDFDDDGDNVPTSTEHPNYSTTAGLTEALDTDGDTIPDYLDTDDDGDGVDTINEESESADQNPVNDITNNEFGPDYLNPNVFETVDATAYRAHTIQQTYTLSITVENFTLAPLTQTEMTYGSLDIDADPCPCSREVIPEFNN